MILLYHLVFPDNTPTDAWNAGKVMRLSQFIRQIEWLRGHYTIVSLNDYLMQVPNGNKVASITFDDGYQKTFDLVHEYLETQSHPRHLLRQYLAPGGWETALVRFYQRALFRKSV